jgi:hypothetical protein
MPALMTLATQLLVASILLSTVTMVTHVPMMIVILSLAAFTLLFLFFPPIIVPLKLVILL